jgi:catechol 2,3-dioxygenase-like lactoylglutathione lyase family enzyme
VTEIKWLDHGVVPTNDLGRAVLFYTRVLGAEIEEIKNIDTATIGEIRSKGRGMMRCFMRLGPTRFGVFLQHKELPPADGLKGSPCYEWELTDADLDRALGALTDAGVKYEGPVAGPPGYPVAKQVFFNDPDGNHVALCVLQ